VTARTEVVAALDPLLDGVTVLPYARNVTPPAQPLVMVRVDRVEPAKELPNHNRYTFALVLLGSKNEPGPADDELDELLEQVIFAINSEQDVLTWESAARGTYENTSYPAYEVTVIHNIKVTEE
jgi:hypothetical protein